MGSESYPRFPLYIPSKGRSAFMITSKALTEMGVQHSVVVEPQEVEDYRRSAKGMGLLANIVELDMRYKEKYELCDEFGLTKSTGSGPARNFIWNHSMVNGHKFHWIMDDNITDFRIMLGAKRVKTVATGFWRSMENFVLRYKNIAMAGPNYTMFAFREDMSKFPPFYVNTRIYSCNLIRNNVPMRWRGRYNEDTILSLDMLKAGWCTVLFNAFLQTKMQTQKLPGGNTAELYVGKKVEGKSYAVGGTTAKSEMLVRLHPDVAKISMKFGRVHHHVNFNKWKKRKLIRDESSETIGEIVPIRLVTNEKTKKTKRTA